MVAKSPAVLAASASHIWMGGPSAAARWARTSARFSPACWRPVKNRAMRYGPQTATMAEVNTPVRPSVSSPAAAARRCSAVRARIFMTVSSLWTSSPCAAWRVSSAKTGASSTAASRTSSHWVAAGSGMPSPRCKTSMRWNGRPAPYLSRPTMLGAVSSYRAAPTPAGAGAVKTSPQRLQRRRAHS